MIGDMIRSRFANSIYGKAIINPDIELANTIHRFMKAVERKEMKSAIHARLTGRYDYMLEAVHPVFYSCPYCGRKLAHG